MYGLIKKDLLLILRSLGPIHAITLIVPLFVALKNKQYFIQIFILITALLFALEVTDTMQSDENVNWQKNVNAMPISLFQEAMSKYILTIILAIISSIISFTLGIIIRFYFLDITISTIIEFTFLGFIIVLVYNSIIIPASYKYGTTKSRYIIMLFMLSPVVVNFLMDSLNININMNMELHTLILILFMITLIMVILSLLLSVRILKNSH
ncbi:ABC-2 transporter permease [Clostridium sporogenes]|uniref:ABC-2 transporter permease n=1 Tax=Clostridium sporogenes TaxID=1509 RepID=UPI003F8EAF88